MRNRSEHQQALSSVMKKILNKFLFIPSEDFGRAQLIPFITEPTAPETATETICMIQII